MVNSAVSADLLRILRLQWEIAMKKILITDDSLFMRKMLKDILLKKNKYEVVEAETGKKAFEQFQQENPDLVLLDIIMPDGEEEGIRVLREIIKMNSRASVVMITAVGQDAVIEECKKSGAKDYIVKPFDEQEVVETVRKHLQ